MSLAGSQQQRRQPRLVLWLLVWTTVTVMTTSASPRRPFLFPLVQALQRNNKQRQQHQESWTDDGFVAEEEPYPQEQDDDDSSPLVPHHHVHSLLQVPCALEVPNSHNGRIPVRTIVDTGAQVTVLSREAAQKCGFLHLLDRRYAGQATGVGSCRVLGRIPAGALNLHLAGTIVESPAITVLENNSMGMELLLGLDFLRDTHAILNMQKEEMMISSSNQQQVMIPFLRSAPENEEEECGGWINNDIISSLQDGCNEYDDDNSDDDDDEGEELDMSGV